MYNLSMVELKLVEVSKEKVECDCYCHKGKCNHVSTSCHKDEYVIKERWLLVVGENKYEFEREYKKGDNWSYIEIPPVIDPYTLSDIIKKVGGRLVCLQNSVTNFYHYRKEELFRVIKKEGEIKEISFSSSRQEPWYSNHDNSHYTETTCFIFLPNKPGRLVTEHFFMKNNPRTEKEERRIYNWNGEKLDIEVKIKCSICNKYKNSRSFVIRCWTCGEEPSDDICGSCAIKELGYKIIRPYGEKAYICSYCQEV